MFIQLFYSHLSTATYVKSPKLAMIEEEGSDISTGTYDKSLHSSRENLVIEETVPSDAILDAQNEDAEDKLPLNINFQKIETEDSTKTLKPQQSKLVDKDTDKTEEKCENKNDLSTSSSTYSNSNQEIAAISEQVVQKQKMLESLDKSEEIPWTETEKIEMLIQSSSPKPVVAETIAELKVQDIKEKAQSPVLMDMSPIKVNEKPKVETKNIIAALKQRSEISKSNSTRRSMNDFSKPKLSNPRRSLAPAPSSSKIQMEKNSKTFVKPSLQKIGQGKMAAETVDKIEYKKQYKAPVLLNISPIKSKETVPKLNITKNTSNTKTVINSTFNKTAPSKKLVAEEVSKPKTNVNKRRSMASTASSRLTLIKPTITASSRIVSHPNPFAARNMYYDERWMEKQENGFKKWLNFVLTPPEDFETPGKLDVAKLWNACTKDVKVPRAPTREVLSVRAYTTRRELNTLRRNACLLWQSPGMAQVITKIETEIEMHRIVMRNDRTIHK